MAHVEDGPEVAMTIENFSVWLSYFESEDFYMNL